MTKRSKISEIYFLQGLLSLYVVVFISMGCSNIQPENGDGDSVQGSLSGIRYTINPPDGGVFFWKLLNHKDGGISYDSMVAGSDSLYGPYSDRYCTIRYGGHNGYFQSPDGSLLATAWCYPDGSPFWQYPSILKLDLDSSGRIYPAGNY